MNARAESFADRVAVITGGGGELGGALGRAFVEAGACVTLLDTGLAARRAHARARKFSPCAFALHTDVSREPAVRRAFRQVIRKWKRLDYLINNAALEGPTAPLEKITLADWNRTLAANLTGAFLCAREAAHWMKRQREGCIIQIGSVGGRIAYPLRLPYSVSKGALEALTRNLAVELGPANIRVNLVSPGPTAGTRIERVLRRRARAAGQSLAQVRESYLKPMVLGRMIKTEDVVRAVLFLCSPAGENITGQTLEVSAGWTAGSL